MGTEGFFFGIEAGGDASVLLLVGVEGVDSTSAFDIGNMESSTRLGVEVGVESDSGDSSDGIIPGGGWA